MTTDDIDEESPYCEACGHCGETGCCSASKCLVVKCKYGAYNIREYTEVVNSLDEYMFLLMDAKETIKNLQLEYNTCMGDSTLEKINKLLDIK